MKFFIYTMAGSAFLLLAILFISFQAGDPRPPTLDVRR